MHTVSVLEVIRVDIDICCVWCVGFKHAAYCTSSSSSGQFDLCVLFSAHTKTNFISPCKPPPTEHKICYRPGDRSGLQPWSDIFHFLNAKSTKSLDTVFRLVMDNINTDYWTASFSLSVSLCILKASDSFCLPRSTVQYPSVQIYCTWWIHSKYSIHYGLFVVPWLFV